MLKPVQNEGIFFCADFWRKRWEYTNVCENRKRFEKCVFVSRN